MWDTLPDSKRGSAGSCIASLTTMLTASQPPPLAAVITLLLGVLSLAVFRCFQDRKLPLPPKPPGLPLIGNTIEFVMAANKGAMHLLLGQWAERYGEIVRVQVGPMTSYYLNSDEAVKVRLCKNFALIPSGNGAQN